MIITDSASNHELTMCCTIGSALDLKFGAFYASALAGKQSILDINFE